MWECWPGLHPPETVDMQLEELSQGELIRLTNVQSSWDEKDEDVPEEVTLAETAH